MRSVSARFATAVTRSHRLAVRAELLSNGAVLQDLPLDAGSVTLDQTAAVRGRCDLTIVDPGVAATESLIPVSSSSGLAPYGNEIRVSRGITYLDGTTELVALGVFRVDTTAVADAPTALTIHVTGQDRSARIAEARFENPYQVTAGIDYAAAIAAVLVLAWPGVPFSTTWPAAAGKNAPALTAAEGDDPWAFAQSMAQAIGMDLYFDGDGYVVLVPSSSLDTGSPVATLAEGDDGVLVSAARSWTRQGTYNRVVATGENTDPDVAPARGVATDDNPLSPTYYYGAFGRVPQFYSSPFLADDDQAATAAATILSRQLGTSQSVSFGSFVLPHLEPGDVARITRKRAGIDENHVIDQITIPLDTQSTMTGATRALQVA